MGQENIYINRRAGILNFQGNEIPVDFQQGKKIVVYPKLLANLKDISPYLDLSADPFTVGHKYLAQRAVDDFGRLTIGIGNNPAKKHNLPLRERFKQVSSYFKDDNRILLVMKNDGELFMPGSVEVNCRIRGVRSTTDLEYELLRVLKYNQAGLEMPTILYRSPRKLKLVSSTLARTYINEIELSTNKLREIVPPPEEKIGEQLRILMERSFKEISQKIYGNDSQPSWISPIAKPRMILIEYYNEDVLPTPGIEAVEIFEDNISKNRHARIYLSSHNGSFIPAICIGRSGTMNRIASNEQFDILPFSVDTKIMLEGQQIDASLLRSIKGVVDILERGEELMIGVRKNTFILKKITRNMILGNHARLKHHINMLNRGESFVDIMAAKDENIPLKPDLLIHGFRITNSSSYVQNHPAQNYIQI